MPMTQSSDWGGVEQITQHVEDNGSHALSSVLEKDL
jgi:hypothetical protein